MIPKESFWLSYGKELHFNINEDTKVLTCKKWINNQAYTINRKLPDTIGGLNSELNRFATLPDEFWKPVE